MTTVDICVCTFRRPQLVDTLRSIAGHTLPAGVEMRVIVADNDDTASSSLLVQQVRDVTGLPIMLVHCPARNISLARNACLEAATAEFLAFVDDDETVTAGWLASLLEAAENTGADVVLGPVQAVYGADAPDWIRRGDFHSTRPVWVNGRIVTGYSCNVLVRRSAPSITGRRFDLARGFTGGEDTAFFDGVFRDGGTFAFAQDAIVEEVVPGSRASFGWLARRRFRSGQTHGGLLLRRRSRRAAPVALAAAKLTYCLAVSLLRMLSPVAARRSLLRGVLHAGTINGLLGGRELALYGQPPHATSLGDARNLS